MAYRATTPAQRAALNTVFSLYRKGTICVYGPRPEDGALLWSFRDHHTTEGHVMDRNGMSTTWLQAGAPDLDGFVDYPRVRRG